jgi:hypothetical protein
MNKRSLLILALVFSFVLPFLLPGLVSPRPSIYIYSRLLIFAGPDWFDVHIRLIDSQLRVNMDSLTTRDAWAGLQPEVTLDEHANPFILSFLSQSMLYAGVERFSLSFRGNQPVVLTLANNLQKQDLAHPQSWYAQFGPLPGIGNETCRDGRPRLISCTADYEKIPSLNGCTVFFGIAFCN